MDITETWHTPQNAMSRAEETIATTTDSSVERHTHDNKSEGANPPVLTLTNGYGALSPPGNTATDHEASNGTSHSQTSTPAGSNLKPTHCKPDSSSTQQKPTTAVSMEDIGHSQEALPSHSTTPTGSRLGPKSKSELFHLTGIEERMREQIRHLQEQRAAAMMNEVVELQREKDLAMGRIKRLERSVADLQAENGVLRSIVGDGVKEVDKSGTKVDLVKRVMFLEQNILEEQLLTSDLRKKLQSADKQNASLLLRMRREGIVGDGRRRRGSIPLHLSVDDQREKSRSLSDLKLANKDVSPPSIHRSDSFETAIRQNLPDKQKQPIHKMTSAPTADPTPIPPVTIAKPPGSAPSSDTTTPQQYYSPTIIPRRYKLAATKTRHIATQTENAGSPEKMEDTGQSKESSEQEDIPHHIVDALATAKRDILRLQQEKQNLESRLSEERKERRDSSRMKTESLQLESSVLQENLSNFSLWVRQKFQQFEEDLDIFKVVCSLHDSLSRDAELQRRVRQLESRNSELEEKYKKAKRELWALREQLSPYLATRKHAPQKSSSPLPSHKLSKPRPPSGGLV